MNGYKKCDVKYEDVCNLVDEEFYLAMPKTVCRISHKLPFMNIVSYFKEVVTYRVGHCKMIFKTLNAFFFLKKQIYCLI